jgi:hypothetical protein
MASPTTRAERPTTPLAHGAPQPIPIVCSAYVTPDQPTRIWIPRASPPALVSRLRSNRPGSTSIAAVPALSFSPTDAELPEQIQVAVTTQMEGTEHRQHPAQYPQLSQSDYHAVASQSFRQIDLPSYHFPHEHPELDAEMSAVFPLLENPTPEHPPSKAQQQMYDFVKVARVLRHHDCAPIARLHHLPNLETIHATGSQKLCLQRSQVRHMCQLIPRDPVRPLRLVLHQLCLSLICQEHTDRRLLTDSMGTVVIDLETIRDREESCLSMGPFWGFHPKRLVFLLPPSERSYCHRVSSRYELMQQRDPDSEPRPCLNLWYRMAMICLQMDETCEIWIVSSEPGLDDPDRQPKTNLSHETQDMIYALEKRMSRLGVDFKPITRGLVDWSRESLKGLLMRWIEECVGPGLRREMTEAQRIIQAPVPGKGIPRYGNPRKGIIKLTPGQVCRQALRQAKSDEVVDRAHYNFADRLVAGNQHLQTGRLPAGALRDSFMSRIKVLTTKEYHDIEGNEDESLFTGNTSLLGI